MTETYHWIRRTKADLRGLGNTPGPPFCRRWEREILFTMAWFPLRVITAGLCRVTEMMPGARTPAVITSASIGGEWLHYTIHSFMNEFELSYVLSSPCG